MLADQAGELFSERDRFVQFGGVPAQVGQQRPVVGAAFLGPAQHQPGCIARRQRLPGRCGQHWPGMLDWFANHHGSLRRTQALEVARERGVAAPAAVFLQRAEQPAAVTATVVPVLKHDVLPWVEHAASCVAAPFAFRKDLTAQMAKYG